MYLSCSDRRKGPGPRAAWIRGGTVLVLFAVFLPLMLSFITLAVDTSVLAVARSQLSTTADAAALAGAMQLASENRLRGATDISTEMTAARSRAITLAGANKVLGQSAILLDNPSNGMTGDIVIGKLGASGFSTAAASMPLFDTVMVTARRNGSHGGQVPSFFGQIMGYTGTDLTVTSMATAETYTISGFKSVNNQGAGLLPIVLDKTTYDAMMAGTTTDQYTYNPVTKSITSGADGVVESKLYPVATGNPGNWGTVNVGVTSNSTSVLGNQIRYGITPAQLATFPNGQISLDTTKSPPSIQFSGDPGISAGIKDDLASIIGKPVTIPIYDQSGGNGNNAWYRVIAFAGVRVLSVNFKGNPKHVIIQPAIIQDPTAIPGQVNSSWESGGLLRVRLTQ